MNWRLNSPSSKTRDVIYRLPFGGLFYFRLWESPLLSPLHKSPED
uniref:Uncharacterized protein n=1 Tax=Myoviridae sp. ctzA421 TaxID=2826719 RepID=A0A8S5LUH2_9CAUD|nr:MAG TPA: hypothetical protein [Myoviridae sp. ctzA421]